MTRWQRRARVVVALFAVAFAVVLTLAFRRRVAIVAPAPARFTDPNAVVESTAGRSFKVTGTREDVSVEYDRTLTYKDGSSKLLGVRIVTTERGGDRTFTVTANEGHVGQNESVMIVSGAVTLVSSDGFTAKTEHAEYSQLDGIVRAPGVVEFARRGLKGSGVGMTYDNNQDVLVILDQARVRLVSSEGGVTDIESPTATVARRDHSIAFGRGMRTVRGGQVVQADSATARLSADQERVEGVELRGHSRVTASAPQPGSLQTLTGRDIDLKYGADGETLEHATVTGDAVLHIAGAAGSWGREITANFIDLSLAPDGTTPVALAGRDAVQLTFPAEQGSAGRTIKARNLDAHGEPGRGLTTARFTGAGGPACLDRRTAAADCDVDFRERTATSGRAARSGSLEVTLKPGMSELEEARFARNVRFEEGTLGAVAATARYVLASGMLELAGREPAAPRPHVVDDQITIDADRTDVTLAGPRMKATGDVQSVLRPRADDPKGERKTPAMLKHDQPVRIVSNTLEYDGAASKATYTGSVKLWQTDTSIQGDTLTLDNRSGDMAASGSVTTSTLLEQRDKQKNKTERVRSVGTAQDFGYEESTRRATYTGQAHLSGPQGDMTADKIELYLQPSGDEVDRAEAYSHVTLREQARTTSGDRLTYTSGSETYVVSGAPLKIVDACGRETVGRKLTFLAGTDTAIIDSGGQSRTQTKTTGQCS